MADINNVNSNFRQIAIADANDNVTGITLSGASSLRVSGGTSGQALVSDGSGGFTWGDSLLSAWSADVPITVGASTTAPTKGTTTTDYIRYRKTGNKIYDIEMNYYQSTAGTAGTGIYLFTLPGGLQLNTAKYATNTNGNSGTISTSSTWRAVLPSSSGQILIPSNSAMVKVMMYDATRFCLVGIGTSIGAAAFGFIQNSNFYQWSWTEAWAQASFTIEATT
jgi:hypothetical protein